MVKYYLSLCCIIKDERYLEEFIAYYRVLGVEHFYIYDNESAHPISQRLNNYVKEFCTILPISGRIQQLNAYHDCIKNLGHETKWLIIVDGDEYILPKKDNHFSIRDFLNEYEDAHAIGINWVLFGTSFYDYKQDGFLIDKYRHCDNNQNPHIKTICQPRFVHHDSMSNPHFIKVHDPSKYIDPHRRVISSHFNFNHTIDIIQINHYSFKSVEEQWEKHRRGYPDTLAKFQPKTNDKIHLEANDKIDNFLPDKYLDIIKSIFHNYVS